MARDGACSADGANVCGCVLTWPTSWTLTDAVASTILSRCRHGCRALVRRNAVPAVATQPTSRASTLPDLCPNTVGSFFRRSCSTTPILKCSDSAHSPPRHRSAGQSRVTNSLGLSLLTSAFPRSCKTPPSFPLPNYSPAGGCHHHGRGESHVLSTATVNRPGRTLRGILQHSALQQTDVLSHGDGDNYTPVTDSGCSCCC